MVNVMLFIKTDIYLPKKYINGISNQQQNKQAASHAYLDIVFTNQNEASPNRLNCLGSGHLVSVSLDVTRVGL